MTAQRETFLTAEGLAQLQQELEQLKSTRRQEVAERVLKASEAGGTVDNAEYEEAKNERAFIEGRVRELEAILFNAKVAPARKKKANKVEFGSSRYRRDRQRAKTQLHRRWQRGDRSPRGQDLGRIPGRAGTPWAQGWRRSRCRDSGRHNEAQDFAAELDRVPGPPCGPR